MLYSITGFLDFFQANIACHLISACFMLGLLINIEDGGDMFL
jgi:hypothetical protein